MTNFIFSLYRRWVLAHPRVWLLVVVAVAVAMASGLPRFKLDASSDSLTLENDTAIDFFRDTYQRYGTGDILVVTYTPHGDLFTDESLSTLVALKEELAQVSGVASTLSIVDVPLLYSPPLSLGDLSDDPRTLLQEGIDWDLARDEFWNSPIYRDTLLGPDGKTTAVLLNLEIDELFLTLVRERDSLRRKQSVEGLTSEEEVRLTAVSAEFLEYRTAQSVVSRDRVAEVRQIVDSYRGSADLFVGGASMITSDMIDFIQSDLVVFGIAVALIIFIVLFLIFRSWRFVFWPLLASTLTVTTILGLLSWLDWRLTVISSNFVALLLIMTMSLTIHLIVRYRETCRKEPELSHIDKMARVTEQMGRPCFYNVLTTMVAFVSLVVSDIGPVIDFGWMMTIGLGIGFLMAFVVVPCGLLVTGEREFVDKADSTGAFTLQFSRLVEARPNSILVVCGVVAILAVYGVSQLTVENRFIDYFGKDTEIYQGMLVIDRQLGGTMPLDIIITAPSEPEVDAETAESDQPAVLAELDELGEELFGDGAGDPFAAGGGNDSDEFDDLFGDDPFADDPFGEEGAEEDFSYWWSTANIGTIDEFHDYLEAQPEIGKVMSLATSYKISADLTDSVPNDIELTLMRELMGEDLESVLISPYLDDSIDQTRINIRVVESDEKLKRDELISRVTNYATGELGLEVEQVQATGLLVLYNNVLQSLFRSQIMTMGAVFLAIMAMLLVLFRSLKLAVCGLAPSLLAAMSILGGMGLFGVALDMMTITIAAITIGIGVDNAIHYIYRFRNEFQQDRNYIATTHRAHGSIGRAMYYTSVIIVLGFSVLSLSEFVPTIIFGVLTGIAMLAALLGSLLLLPRLLAVLKPFGPETS